MAAMRKSEAHDAARLVCPTCGGPLDLTRSTASTASARSAGFALSDVERQVLELLLQGYRVAQIAATVGTSVSTVRKRLRRLLAKTGTRSQAELIARCRAQGAPAASPRRSRRPRT